MTVNVIVPVVEPPVVTPPSGGGGGGGGGSSGGGGGGGNGPIVGTYGVVNSSGGSSGGGTTITPTSVPSTTCQRPVTPIGFGVSSGIPNDKHLELFYFAPNATLVIAQYGHTIGSTLGFGWTTSQTHLSLAVPKNGAHYWVRIFAADSCGVSGWTNWFDPTP